MDEITQKLIEEIDKFNVKHDLTDSGFGRRALNNPNFVSDLRSGQISPTTRTVTKLRVWMRNNTTKKGKVNDEQLYS